MRNKYVVQSFDVVMKPKKLLMVIKFRSEQKLSSCQSKLLQKIDRNAGASDNYLYTS